MSFLDVIAEAIWKRLKPEVDELQKMAQTEADEWQVIAQQQLNEWRAEAMKMLSEALPEMAAKVAEQTVLTVFDKTEVDEAANAVSGVITDIVGRLRFPFLGGQQ